jgi:hypothetical protein
MAAVLATMIYGVSRVERQFKIAGNNVRATLPRLAFSCAALARVGMRSCARMWAVARSGGPVPSGHASMLVAGI